MELTSSNRRSLLDQEEDLEDETAIEARRLDFDDCATCEEAYDTVCFASTTVCDLEDFGPPLSAAAAASVDVVCGVFGKVCSTFDPNAVCRPGDQCTGEGACCSTNIVMRFLGATYRMIRGFRYFVWRAERTAFWMLVGYFRIPLLLYCSFSRTKNCHPRRRDSGQRYCSDAKVQPGLALVLIQTPAGAGTPSTRRVQRYG